MVILYNNKKECCGCTACKSICPKQAIIMDEDEYGFLYPVINKDLCIECGLCKKVCAFKNPLRLDKKPIATYAAIHKDKKILKNSSSGGAFAALALNVLENKGVVFGCTMTDDFEIKHIKISREEELRKLQGSKYVQSNLKDTYFETKEYLQSGRNVLYTGTPCQIDGLKSFLGADYENLITADLICHGVPSPKFFTEYIKWLEQKQDARVIGYKFRDKSKSGMVTIGKAIYKKQGLVHDTIINYNLDYYYYYFMYGVSYRECCYECPYASSNRPADFTLGDYWGIEEVHPEIDTKNGVSVILVNSEKGEKLLDKLKLGLFKSSFERASAKNNNLCRPTKKSSDREVVLKIFREEGAQAVAEYFQKSLGKKIILYKIKAMIPNSIKKKVKSMLWK